MFRAKNKKRKEPKFKVASTFVLVILIFSFSFSTLQAQAPNLESVVIVEHKDASGKTLNITTGIIVRDGYVATNYHIVPGSDHLEISKYGSKETYSSPGYLAVKESKDLIILQVPDIKGPAAEYTDYWKGEEDADYYFFENAVNRAPVLRKGKYSRMKEIDAIDLVEVTSKETNEATNGPVFKDGKVVGIAVAGYLDDRYYMFMIPSKHLRSILNISMIIKSFESLDGSSFRERSHFHSLLMESLTAVLWIPFEKAVELAQQKNKKIMVDVFADWCGWCKLMQKNTYSKKKIIRYINENFYAVRLNAEGRDTIQFKGQRFIYKDGLRAHELAYSLLDGKMSYPATAFLDQDINLLTVVPGYVDPVRAEVILNYFNEGAYLDNKQSFEDFKRGFQANSPDR